MEEGVQHINVLVLVVDIGVAVRNNIAAWIASIVVMVYDGHWCVLMVIRMM